MKEEIIKLIKTDLKLAQFLECLRSKLDINADPISTDNAVVILSLMRIRAKDEVLERYFDLVNSVNDTSSLNQVPSLPELVYEFLESCQSNPELINTTTHPIQVGLFQVLYSQRNTAP